MIGLLRHHHHGKHEPSVRVAMAEPFDPEGVVKLESALARPPTSRISHIAPYLRSIDNLPVTNYWNRQQSV
jgi:hypothetical protein